jgi:hypothetical protein
VYCTGCVEKGTVAKLEIDCRWHDATLSVYFNTGIFLVFITLIQFINQSPLAEVRLHLSSSLVSSVRKTSLGCRAGNRTRVCLAAS